MLKLNLRKDPAPLNLRPIWYWAAGVFFLLLLWQTVRFVQKQSEIQHARLEIESLKSRIEALHTEIGRLSLPESPDNLNGALFARNEWLKNRENGPVLILAKLEREHLEGVEMKSFESDRACGTLRLLAGDMDGVARYMNAVFGTLNNRVTMEERVANGIVAACSWTE